MRESLLQLLDGEKPDGVVWTADITYWLSARRHYGSGNPSWQEETGYLQLHRELGVMPYFWYPDFSLARTHYDSCIESSSETRGDTTVRRLKTPVGELREETQFAPESCSQAVTRHLVESRDDLKTMLYVLGHRRYEPYDMVAYHDRCRRWVEYDGLPSIGMPRSPLPSLCYEWAGLQNAVYLMQDCPDEVAEALRLMEEQERPIIETACEAQPVLLHFPDNLSSDNLTSYFDAYMAPAYRRRLAPLHAANIKIATHLDGVVKGLLPKLAALGIDAIEALTPKPAGDLDLAEMRAAAASDTVILWGGVPGAMFAPPFTWEHMKTHVEALLASWGGQPFVVGVADQVPPDGDIDFCRKIADIIAAAPG